MISVNSLDHSNDSNNKVDHFKVKLRLPLVYHVGFSIKGEVEVDAEVDAEVDGEVDGKNGGKDGGTNTYQSMGWSVRL